MATFNGWYKESGLTNLWDFGSDLVTGDTTLYAKWTRQTSTNFEGWYADEALTIPWDFDTDLVEGNMTLYAKWSANPSTNKTRGTWHRSIEIGIGV